jgi:hypothetical protein
MKNRKWEISCQCPFNVLSTHTIHTSYQCHCNVNDKWFTVYVYRCHQILRKKFIRPRWRCLFGQERSRNGRLSLWREIADIGGGYWAKTPGLLSALSEGLNWSVLLHYSPTIHQATYLLLAVLPCCTWLQFLTHFSLVPADVRTSLINVCLLLLKVC